MGITGRKFRSGHACLPEFDAGPTGSVGEPQMIGSRQLKIMSDLRDLRLRFFVCHSLVTMSETSRTMCHSTMATSALLRRPAGRGSHKTFGRNIPHRCSRRKALLRTRGCQVGAGASCVSAGSIVLQGHQHSTHSVGSLPVAGPGECRPGGATLRCRCSHLCGQCTGNVLAAHSHNDIAPGGMAASQSPWRTLSTAPQLRP